MPCPGPIRRSIALLALLAVSLGAAQDAPAELPVTRLVASTAGVAYFEHEGTVTGMHEMALEVPVEAMDDLLQSLVLEDFGGGSVRPVRYDARDPLARVLASYPLDLSGAPSLAELLAQARGEALVVEADRERRGTLVGVERERVDDAERVRMTLSTEDGLVRVDLEAVRRVRFRDPQVRAEFDAALEAIAQHREAGTRTVRLRFEGEGERRVRIGYVREMPVWKTTYRLLTNPDGRATLQGWAILDNPTALDLEDVEVAFVAGRPVSFVAELFDPVYVERPRVRVDAEAAAVPEADAGAAPQARAFEAEQQADDAAGLAAPPARAAPSSAGVEALASGEAGRASFVYRVDEPVSVGRYASAMVPIVRAEVPAVDVTYVDAGGETPPWRALHVENATALRLAAGPVSVFDAGGFAGNARLGHVPAGAERMLAYAEDLDLSVRSERDADPERLVEATLSDGVLTTRVRQRRSTTYTLRPAGDTDRRVVLDHPRADDFEPVAPEPAPEVTEGAYRFVVALGEASGGLRDQPTHRRCEAGEACMLEVVEEREVGRTLRVLEAEPDRIALLLENAALSGGDAATLHAVLDARRALAEVDRELASVEERRSALHREQERIRANMAALDSDEALYRRYVRELEAQEDELNALEDEEETLRRERQAVRERLADLVGGVSGD